MTSPVGRSGVDAGAAPRQVSLRSVHVEQVLALLRSGPVSRAELGARTALSRATISSIVGDLIDQGIAVNLPPGPDRRAGSGRPAQAVALSQHRVRSVGVDFRLDGASVALADPLQQVTGTISRTHRRGLNWQDRTTIALEAIRTLCARHGVDLAAPQGIGVGVPGPVPLTPSGAPWRVMVHRLQDELAAPVYVDNNLRLSALAETIWSTRPGPASLLYFHLGRGIGGGVVIDGRLYRGATGSAGELGHVTVTENGPRCHCGKHGCLEQHAALPALLRRAGLTGDRRAVDQVAADPRLAGPLHDAAGLCGRVVGDALAALDICHVIVGGILAHVPDDTLTRFTDAARERLLPSIRGALQIRPSTLQDAGALGGLALVHHNTPVLQGYLVRASTSYESTQQSR
ncbi:ROK family protein [Leekyejoonella antrihumi]|nr:ROK family transcriptional regulator [Leekyejoonella antrihumi]